MNGRERVLKMVGGETVDSLPLMPITMMFAADQIKAPYRAYVTDYRVLVEAQLHTASRFDLDHVSCISDPAREIADLGAEIQFFDDQPPATLEERSLLLEKGRLSSLQIPEILSGGRMHDRVLAAAELKKNVGEEKMVEGWIEGPCCLAANLRGINRLMLDFYDDPAFVHELMGFGVELALAFAKAQREAGADLMGVGDAPASLVGPGIFQSFAVPHHSKLVAGLRQFGFTTRSHICGNTTRILAAWAGLGYDIMDLDSNVSMTVARQRMGMEQVLLGNVATVAVLRQGTRAETLAAVSRVHQACGPRYIVGAGCEVPRDSPEENMFALRDYAREGGNAVAKRETQP